jgi:histidine phosphotransferase ChpT
LKIEIDVGILELLSSKICHDLISPIGAINNGVEILEEMGPDADGEVAALIAFSAAQASAKLQAYRLAYGAGGADANISAEDVYNKIEALISGDKKIKQDWSPQTKPGGESPPRGFCKTMACALLLAMDCLPKGGILTVENGENGAVIIRASGENAALKEKTEAALSASGDESVRQPKFVHALLSGLIARSYGLNLAVAQTGDGFVSFSLGTA